MTEDEKSRPARGGSSILGDQSTGVTADQADALKTARNLIEGGVPVFLAKPCRGAACSRSGHQNGKTEYDLPVGWQRSTPDVAVLDRWQQGDALGAVGGHVADFLDNDPRNGGDASVAELESTGHMPRVFGVQATPSGGFHYVISPLGERETNGFMPGLDYQGGLPNGESRAFVWIAPTVKKSKDPKTLGQALPYTWVQEPDMEWLADFGDDGASENLRARLLARKAPKKDVAQYAGKPRAFTLEQAERWCQPYVERLEAASVGEIEDRCNELAATLSHFVPSHWTFDLSWSVLETALHKTAYNGETWSHHKFRAVVDGSRPLNDPWKATRVDASLAPDSPAPAERKSRRVDLSAFLDGSYSPPVPSVGMARSDGKLLIYPERWHTIIGPNGTGKSFLALAHAIAEMEQGHTVAYAHFEESSPGGTLTRLRAMAPQLSIETISDLFVWLDCSSRWRDGEWTAELKEINPSFVILDGINRACTQHGWDPSDINAPGSYGAQFVTPARVVGAAVLSLGHPPKAKGRETERHGFGSTAWLDDLEGVGFRLIPSKKRIKDGAHGYAMLYSVKDRYGEVEKGLEPADGKDMDGWYTVGSFWVDSTEPGRSAYGIKPEELNEEGEKKDKIDLLGEAIIAALMNAPAQDGQFKSIGHLEELLRTNKAKFTATDVAPAVNRLVKRGVLDSPEVPPRSARRGNFTLTYSAGSIEGLIS